MFHMHLFTDGSVNTQHYELYQQFYQLTAALNCKFVKVIGHQASSRKGKIHQLFGLVDQASRRALRENC